MRNAKLTLASGLMVLISFGFLTGCVTVHDRDPSGGVRKDVNQKLTSLKQPDSILRKRMLVLPFLNESTEKDPNLLVVGREAMLGGLRATDNFVIVDNNDLNIDLNNYRKDVGYDLVALSKLASNMGIVGIIEGRILEIKTKKTGDEVGIIREVRVGVTATAGIRVFATNTKKEIMNEVRTGQSQEVNKRIMENEKPSTYATDPMLVREALVGAFQSTIPAVVRSTERIMWAGKIALVNGDRVYLNAGRLTGLNIGDILRVSDETADVFDPETGLLIGKAPGRMKGTLEVVSYFGKDGAIAVVHSGSGFKENDHVELY